MPVPNASYRTAIADADDNDDAAGSSDNTGGGLLHNTGEALREIARSKLWQEAADNTYAAVEEIVNSERWGEMAEGTNQAISEVWDNPWGRGALLFAGTTLLPAISIATEGAALQLGTRLAVSPAAVELGRRIRESDLLGQPSIDLANGALTQGPPPFSLAGLSGYTLRYLYDDYSGD
ncbi:hypothetical protein DQK91_01945 [Oceanidesulfovibrio marinus]|uniref:Uncharacterized protein n=1 Tax=Oceanidesulfovibrio marinus TaxID=370038 RepID=A0A6P1ZLL9_9BACT|nr:hypothetical protein DQK91_01945 [Oceanidesulfovibrio marinus]